MTPDAKPTQPVPEPREQSSPAKKRILPRPGKHETLEQSLKRIHEQYGEALRRLAQ
jgi:hypothetical protein